MFVLAQRERHPSWGAKKLRDLLLKRFADATPSMATIARILKRAGLVRDHRRRLRRRHDGIRPCSRARA